MNKDKSLGLSIGIIIGALMITLMLFFTPADMTRNYQKGFTVGYERCENKLVPEVVNGNLYIGYEDGRRIGYHEWNGTWFRCVDGCEEIKDIREVNERGTD